MNKVLLIGRLTKDAEIRYSKEGKAVTSFTLAVNRTKEQVDYIRITAFNKTAENVANYTRKGSLVAVEGTIVTGSYEKNGQRIYTTDIWTNTVQFLESKGKGSGEQKESVRWQNKASDDPFANSSMPIDIPDDGLPF